jgi:hypothetical protein
MSKTTPRKSITLRVPSSVKEWWRWLTSRGRQAASQFVGCLGIAFFIVIAVVAVLYLTGRPQEASGVEDVYIFIIMASIFLWYFILIFLSSFHPKTRKWADKQFHFRDLTEIDELKARVDTIEKGTLSQNEKADKELDDIRGRLESIEAALEELANKKNKRSKDD